MLRLLTTILLLACIVGVGYIVVTQIKSYTQNASLILSGIDRGRLEQTIRDHYKTHVTKTENLTGDATVHITPVDISNDGMIDVVTHVDSDTTCGSGGCIHTIFVQKNDGEFVPLDFAYAVKEIEVLSSITDGMHDLKLNNSTENIMKWNGEKYSFESY